MATLLRVLIVEGRAADAELMLRELRRAGFDPAWQRVETEPDYVAHLDPTLDLILTDYRLPQFDAIGALSLLQERGLDIPFIVISGTIGDEAAAECVKRGVTDYIVKDRLASLGPAVGRALEQKRLRDKREQAEAALRESEARKGAILESALDGIITIDHAGRVIEFNPAAEKLFGYTRSEVMGRDMAEVIIPPALRERHRRGLAHYLATGEGPVLGRQIQMPAMRADGTEFPVELAIIRIRLEGRPIFTGYVRDITERTRAEETLRDSQARYQNLFDSVPVGIYRTTPAGQFLDVNLALVEMLGYPDREALLAINALALYVNPEDRKRWQDLMEREGVMRGFDVQFRRYDGATIWVENNARVVRDADGRVLYYEGSNQDFTERKGAEEQIRRAKKFSEMLINSSVDGILAFDRDCRYTVWNPGMERISGVSAEECLGRCAFDVFPFLKETGEDRYFYAALEGRTVIAKDRPYNVPETSRAGFFEGHYSPLRSESGEIVGGLVIIRDITERKRGEETLQALYWASLEIQTPLGLQDRLDRLLQTAREVLDVDRLNILLADPEGQWLQAVAALGSREPLEAIRVPIGPEGGGLAQAYLTKQMIVWDGMAPVPELLRLKPPYDRIEAFRSKVFANLPLIVQGQAIGVLGADRYHSRRPLDSPTLELLQLFTGQAALAIEHGRLYEAQRMAAIQLEATVEARTRDLQVANVRLEEASRVAEEASRHKSEFLANMSHELRTPLNSILGFSELLAQQAYGPLTEKQARHVANIRTAGEHLLALINDLLDLAKVEAGKLDLRLQTFSLREATAAVLREIHPIGDAKSLALKLHVDAAPATLTADPVRFKQILYNLLSNAVKFTPAGGSVTVTAKRVPSSEFQVPGSRDASEVARPGTWNLQPGTADFVEISVADTGIGIKAEDLPKLFQPFTQLGPALTKEAQGSGLGLALTRRLVELHGGTIWAESAGEGRGSTFTVRLPQAGSPRTPRLLIADDDETLLGPIGAALEAAGCEVVAVGNGASALGQVATARPDLVILDLRLPTVDGWAVLQQLRADPQTRALPVLAITGVDVDQGHEVLTAGADEFLTKPFSLTVLESAVRRLLLPAVSAGQLREPRVTP